MFVFSHSAWSMCVAPSPPLFFSFISPFPFVQVTSERVSSQLNPFSIVLISQFLTISIELYTRDMKYPTKSCFFQESPICPFSFLTQLQNREEKNVMLFSECFLCLLSAPKASEANMGAPYFRQRAIGYCNYGACGYCCAISPIGDRQDQHTSGKTGCNLPRLFDGGCDDGVSAGMGGQKLFGQCPLPMPIKNQHI